VKEGEGSPWSEQLSRKNEASPPKIGEKKGRDEGNVLSHVGLLSNTLGTGGKIGSSFIDGR